MGKTLREVIRDTTYGHLEAGNLVMGQCLSAVGFVANTVPDHPGLTELPMSDVAGAYFAVGAALANRRPMLILRYQGFSWLAANAIVNYAAKSKALWGRPCPLLVRSIAMEGRIGPTSGSSHHSMMMRAPGMRVYAPMTPFEWSAAYDEFMSGDEPLYLSEHRKSYDNGEDLPTFFGGKPDVVIAACSITRFAAIQAAVELAAQPGIVVCVHHIWRLKPFKPLSMLLEDLSAARYGGIVLDDDYPDGAAKSIALDLHALTGARMRAYGLKDRTAGFAERFDNLPPDKEEIKAIVRRIVE